MRFNPRILSYRGPFDKKRDEYSWQTGGLVGLTLNEWIPILNLASNYVDVQLKDINNSEQEHYYFDQRHTIDKIYQWFVSGPKSFNKEKPGLYRSRNNEVILLLENYAGVKQLLVQASLYLYHTDKNNSTHQFLKDIDSITDIARSENYNEENKPINKRSAFSIQRRREEIFRNKKIKFSTKEFLAEIRAKHAGEAYVAQSPISERVPPKRAIYEKPKQRPCGSSYDLPTPRVKIGDKLRLSFGRGPEIAYYKKQLVRNQIKRLRELYGEWAKDNPEYKLPVKIHHGNKTQIRRMIHLIENAYEIEVAGVIAHPSQPYVANQCYIGGGAGWSGLSYNCAILFRGEQPNDDPTREPDQVSYLLYEFCIPDYHVERYVMDME